MKVTEIFAYIALGIVALLFIFRGFSAVHQETLKVLGGF